MLIKTEFLEEHPEILEFYVSKDSTPIEYTMKEVGQVKPITIVKDGDRSLVIDGFVRLGVARQNPSLFPELECQVIELNGILPRDWHILHNTNAKKSITQICREVESVLGLLGKQQGVKRSTDILKTSVGIKVKGTKMDRYDWAKIITGFDYSSKTLEKLMKVYWSEQRNRKGLIDKIDSRALTIHKASELVDEMDRKKLSIVRPIISSPIKNCDYELYCKSSIRMEEVADNSVDLTLDSHPYLSMRKYRHQDEMKHGQESTEEEYIKNFLSFEKEKFRKLRQGGVNVSIIGESRQGEYKSIVSQIELGMRQIGYKILDVCIWEKTNAQYAPHPFCFVNAYEKIIVAYKPGGKIYFKEVAKLTSSGEPKVRPTSKGGHYVSNPYPCITNVIRTPCFNPVELTHIDPDFQHDAPAPEQLYKIFIEAYTRPGDTILDSFVGSGTVGVGLKMGRKVIGYDVDPVSMEFCQKRFDWYLSSPNLIDLKKAS